VGEIIGGIVSFRDNRKFRPGDAATILTNLQPVDDPAPGSGWHLDIEIGAGPTMRTMRIDLQPVLPKSYRPDVPYFIGTPETAGPRLVYFRDRLFIAERRPVNALEQEEVILRVKKITYDEETELSALRDAVANIEAAIEFQRSGPKRDPIPEHVKLIVWARDGGSCSRCGSKQALHFDHVIPVAKGGGNSEANVQILCQACNLRKSDKIAIT
jgi:hypothetical protein